MSFLVGCMYVWNFVFLLMGGSMMGAGIWLLIDEERFQRVAVIDSYYFYWEYSVYILIGAGAAILLVTVLGCVGTCASNNISLLIHGLLLTLAIIAELVAFAFLVILFVNVLSGAIREEMANGVRDKYVDEYSADSLSQAWNGMQLQWKCCGSNYYTDYRGSRFQVNSPPGVNVPWTCCKLKNGVSPKHATINDVMNYTACQREAAIGGIYDGYVNYLSCYYTEMEFLMKLTSALIYGMLAAYVIAQLIGLCTSCALRHHNQEVAPARTV